MTYEEFNDKYLIEKSLRSEVLMDLGMSSEGIAMKEVIGVVDKTIGRIKYKVIDRESREVDHEFLKYDDLFASVEIVTEYELE